MVTGLLVTVWAWRVFNTADDPDAAMQAITDWVPGWLTGTFGVVYGFLALYVVGLFVVLAGKWRERLDALRDVLAAAGVTLALVLVFTELTGGDWSTWLPDFGADPIARFPILGVALITACVRAMDPQFTRPMRAVGGSVIVLSAVAGVGLGLGLASSAVGAIALGVAASSTVLVGFGSPRGYPDLESIEDALAVLGIEVSDLHLDDDQSWGVRRLVGETLEFGRVEVKAYGRDATDSQFFARLWRYLWYRDTEASLTLTRMQSVEHEALVTMMAARTSATVPAVLAAGMGGDDVAILAVDRSGSRLTDVDADEIVDDDLEAIWRSVGELHLASIYHGTLNAAAITLTESGHQIGDFGSSALGAPESFRALDVVELLFSLSHLVGVDRAVESAAAGLGLQPLEGFLPYVQLPAVQPATRRRVEKPKALMSEIRDKLIELTGAETDETAEIRRLSPRGLIMGGLSLFAAYFLITQLSGIDFGSVWDVLQGATWAWVVLAFIVGQFVYFPEATAMLAAVGYPIPLKAAVVLQSAIKFISLAVPSSAGRIGMTATFLRKYGVSFTASLVQGSIDTVSGLIVEISILLLAFLFGDLNFGLTSGDPEWMPILLVVSVLGLLVVLLVQRVDRLREWVMPIIGEAWGALGSVIKDPKRTFLLLASNFASRFVLAVSMWLILQSMGVSLGVFSVLAATVLTGLLGGVIPVPGGVGVSEAVLTASLVIFGVDETVAFAGAVVYRVATFYIPSGAGWFSMRWLEKYGYM